MINALFLMHNIKYIICVDDCFFARKREDMEAIVYGEMCSSIDPFRMLLSSCKQSDAITEIDEILRMGLDSSSRIYSLLKELSDDDLLKCYEKCEENGIKYTEERDAIIAFLDELKNKGQIQKYLTFPSASEANKFDPHDAGMADGAILWLLDRNFSRSGESEETGIKLAENIIAREQPSQNYIYILSAIGPDTGIKEDDIEEEFDRLLTEHCSLGAHSFIYYISKQRLQSKCNNKIAKSFAQGFKRKACFELFQTLSNCLSNGVSNATVRVQGIRQKTLNYLFTNKASLSGEPYTEVAARIVQILQADEYNSEIAKQHSLIAKRARYYEKLCSTITETVGDERALTSALKEYRDIELYNKHINAQHSEIATGDIFQINTSYYLLVSQACDTCLRSDGQRKLKHASLIEIRDNSQTEFSYSLSCFLDMKKPEVIYHALKSVPFDILDLCVLNTNGQARVELKEIDLFTKELESYTKNYQIRFKEILDIIQNIHANKTKLNSYLSGNRDTTAENAKQAYEYLEKLDPNMKEYSDNETSISFPVRRITRLNELTTIDILKEYGLVLSRIGHPFDFLKKTTSK